MAWKRRTTATYEDVYENTAEFTMTASAVEVDALGLYDPGIAEDPDIEPSSQATSSKLAAQPPDHARGVEFLRWRGLPVVAA
jgi:hypothetical protein